MKASETRIKICGITNPTDMREALAAGADYLGFVFAEGSPRQISLEQILPWLEEAREGAELVGVFRNQDAGWVEEISHAADLDIVQLHGEEAGSAWHGFPVRLIEARIVPADHLPPARLQGHAWAQLLDGGAGDGRPFRWELGQELARSERLFLAGGLHPGNVGEAVAALSPFAVDVSSGVESSPGKKDPALIRAFVEAAKGRTQS